MTRVLQQLVLWWCIVTAWKPSTFEVRIKKKPIPLDEMLPTPAEPSGPLSNELWMVYAGVIPCWDEETKDGRVLVQICLFQNISFGDHQEDMILGGIWSGWEVENDEYRTMLFDPITTADQADSDAANPEPSRVRWHMNYLYAHYWGLTLKRQMPRLKKKPDCPFFYIYGRRKPFMFHTKPWLETISDDSRNKVWEVAKGGHWMMLDQPKIVNEAVKGWLLMS